MRRAIGLLDGRQGSVEPSALTKEVLRLAFVEHARLSWPGEPADLGGALAVGGALFEQGASIVDDPAREIRGLLAPADADDVESLGVVYEACLDVRLRRRTGAHYTPRALAESVVEQALAPHLALDPSSRRISNLRIFDPAMGTGVFLLAACRYLAEQLVAARAREGAPIERAVARRLIATQCLYGVDKDPRATELARLSIWLLAGGWDEPFDFMKMNLLSGDSLLGVHYPRVFTHVFERPARGFDAVIGNPPFLGGKRISTELGVDYASRLSALHGTTKNVDLSAHFLRRAAEVAAIDGTIGFITTNSIAEGATRLGGLAHLLRGDWRIYSATPSQRWPGAAGVYVSIVHLARGASVRAAGQPMVDGRAVAFVDSTLKPHIERAHPEALLPNRAACFIGCFLRGSGFVLDAAEAARFLENGASSVVRPFLGGEEINTSPTLSPHRFVIDFSGLSLDQASAHPALVDLVRARVKPVRDRLGRSSSDVAHKRRWWQFANTRPELRAALAGLERCIVAPRVTKHLSFVFQPTTRVFSDQLCVFPLDRDEALGVLSSVVHEVWARKHSSHLAEGLRYTPSSCVATFPFAGGSPHATLPSVAAAARSFDAARGAALTDLSVGITALENRAADLADQHPLLLEFRVARRALDVAVLEAYGWSDLVALLAVDVLAAREAILERLFAEHAARLGSTLDG
ncbi:MAG: DNA methyltransferase [Polyangiaceae bacterium]